MTPTQFLDSISSLEMPSTFNPYRHHCPDFDVENAPSIRLDNLRKVLLSALDANVDVIWIARDLGYRGGRRTGLALTDEAHLCQHAAFYRNLELLRSTRGPVASERTASMIWNMLVRIKRPVFLWNVFPLHPFEASSSQTNRCHTRNEAKACSHLLMWLLERLNPKVVIGLGLEAHSALERISVDHVKARHPSYGGKTEFENTIFQTFEINRENDLPQATTLELRF